DKIIADPDKKGFEFESDTTEIPTLIGKILAISESDDPDVYTQYTKAIANRLHRKEVDSDSKNNLRVDLLKGILVISLVKFDNDTQKMIISKADYNEFLDVLSYKKRQGFPIKKKIYKAFVADIDNESVITKVAVYDTNSVFTVYWYRDFLELKEVHTDEYNTEKAFNLIETKIITSLKKKSKQDYIELWNATVRYFRIKPEFAIDDYVNEIIAAHVPFDENLDVNDLGKKTKNQFQRLELDTKFTIIP